MIVKASQVLPGMRITGEIDTLGNIVHKKPVEIVLVEPCMDDKRTHVNTSCYDNREFIVVTGRPKVVGAAGRRGFMVAETIDPESMDAVIAWALSLGEKGALQVIELFKTDTRRKRHVTA